VVAAGAVVVPVPGGRGRVVGRARMRGRGRAGAGHGAGSQDGRGQQPGGQRRQACEDTIHCTLLARTEHRKISGTSPRAGATGRPGTTTSGNRGEMADHGRSGQRLAGHLVQGHDGGRGRDHSQPADTTQTRHRQARHNQQRQTGEPGRTRPGPGPRQRIRRPARHTRRTRRDTRHRRQRRERGSATSSRSGVRGGAEGGTQGRRSSSGRTRSQVGEGGQQAGRPRPSPGTAASGQRRDRARRTQAGGAQARQPGPRQHRARPRADRRGACGRGTSRRRAGG
jgi:hypothetical protein